MIKSTKYLGYFLSVSFFFNFNWNSVAQSGKDTLHLPEFEVKSNYIFDNLGFKRVKLDSITLIPHINADLSTILTEYSTIFIKSYGNGTLSTPSFRGTTAQHTQVEWNGINLNSPMLGQIDLSLVPVSQFDGIEILYGAAGISRTSGAFGGVINLVTNPDWNNIAHLLVAQTIGSFDNYTTDVNAALGNRFFQSHTKFNFSSGLNDFPYYNDYLGKYVNQQNASFKIYGISQEFFWKLKDKHLFNAKVWYSQADRDLPPTTSNADSAYTEKLSDKSLRAVIEYKYVEPGLNLLAHSAISDQAMKYRSLLISSNHQPNTWINRIRFTYNRIRKLSLKPGIDFNYDWVYSDNYEGMKTRSTLSLFAEINYEFNKKIKSSLVVRDDIIDGKFMPVIPAIGLEYKPFNKINLQVTANAARNYRFPTLNELYWEISGNPDLKPETNYITELGLIYNLTSGNKILFLEFTLSGYYSWIYDMIVWTPVEGNSSLWRPENVRQVNARGFEIGTNIDWQILGFYLGLKANYTFCRSTNEKSIVPDDNIVGKQLIYVPVDNLNSTISLQRWKFYFKYNFLFVGKRFTSTDNSYYMPAYSLSNIILGKNFALNNFILSLQVQINNLFNIDYQSVASRPMAGINYSFTLKFSFIKSVD